MTIGFGNVRCNKSSRDAVTTVVNIKKGIIGVRDGLLRKLPQNKGFTKHFVRISKMC